MGQKERLEKIKSVGDAYRDGYNNDRLAAIYNAFTSLDDEDFYKLCSIVVNKFRFIPLLDDWVESKRGMNIKIVAIAGDDCNWCKGSGWVSAIVKATQDRLDAFGNAYPEIEEFACGCNKGRNIDSRSFTQEDRQNYILVSKK